MPLMTKFPSLMQYNRLNFIQMGRFTVRLVADALGLFRADGAKDAFMSLSNEDQADRLVRLLNHEQVALTPEIDVLRNYKAYCRLFAYHIVKAVAVPVDDTPLVAAITTKFYTWLSRAALNNEDNEESVRQVIYPRGGRGNSRHWLKYVDSHNSMRPPILRAQFVEICEKLGLEFGAALLVATELDADGDARMDEVPRPAFTVLKSRRPAPVAVEVCGCGAEARVVRMFNTPDGGQACGECVLKLPTTVAVGLDRGAPAFPDRTPRRAPSKHDARPGIDDQGAWSTPTYES